MLRVLVKRGVVPDLIVGNSVGALNGAWLAGDPSLDGVEALAEIWCSIRRSDVFPVDPLGSLLALLGRRRHLVPVDGLERLLRRHLPFARLEDARVPLHVVATEVTTGQEVLLSEGEAVPAILASAALPGVYPPVTVASRELMDGAVVNNTPISHAVRLGASVVYVLPTGYACSLAESPSSALGMALQALTLLVEQRLMHDVARYEDEVELHVIPPLCPLSVSPADFTRSSYLMDRARAATGRWLDGRPPLRGPEQILGFHRHQAPPDGLDRKESVGGGVLGW